MPPKGVGVTKCCTLGRLMPCNKLRKTTPPISFLTFNEGEPRRKEQTANNKNHSATWKYRYPCKWKHQRHLKNSSLHAKLIPLETSLHEQNPHQILRGNSVKKSPKTDAKNSSRNTPDQPAGASLQWVDCHPLNYLIFFSNFYINSPYMSSKKGAEEII